MAVISILYTGGGYDKPEKTEKLKEGYERCPHCNGAGMCDCVSCGVDVVKENTRFQRYETKDQYGHLIGVDNRPYNHVETVREKGICKVCNLSFLSKTILFFVFSSLLSKFYPENCASY